jgi:hypothetical protein
MTPNHGSSVRWNEQAIVNVDHCWSAPRETWKDAAHLHGKTHMDLTTLLIIVLLVVLLGGGGWYGRGRWYGR